MAHSANYLEYLLSMRIELGRRRKRMSKQAKTITNLVFLAILLVVIGCLVIPLMTDVVVPKWIVPDAVKYINKDG